MRYQNFVDFSPSFICYFSLISEVLFNSQLVYISYYMVIENRHSNHLIPIQAL